MMSIYDDPNEGVQQLLRTALPEKQLALRAQIPEATYFGHMREIYLNNPFLKLTDEELAHFRNRTDDELVSRLIVARDVASKTDSPKISVFCMPKSGSSFVQSALQSALELPFVSVTSVANPGASSYYGMNGREQELDEFAIVKSILDAPLGFVSQNHTRCTMYLANQLRFYGIRPIVTVRNVLDCIVSFDDMMLSWREGKGGRGWLNDAPYVMPLNYPELEQQARYRIIAASYGVWLIAFYVSWKRCVNSKFLTPLVLQYEADVLNHEQLISRLSTYLELTEAQKERLARYVRQPDRQRSRVNVGVQGRGRQKIDAAVVDGLLAYARSFEGELSENEFSYLFG